MVDYVKDNFLLAREFANLEDLNSQACAWLDNTAHTRVHATTGHRPIDLLESERPKLKSLDSIRPYKFIERHPRKVVSCPPKLVPPETINFRSGKDRQFDEEAIFG